MQDQENQRSRVVYLVDGLRTPFLKARGKPGPFTAADLAVQAARDLLTRLDLDPKTLDEVITGCVMPSADEANISRIIALRLGCGDTTPAWTVQRNCASGLQSIDNAWMDIKSGRHDLVLAGGTEAMSHAPLLFNKAMVNWLSGWFAAKTTGQRLKLLPKFRLHFLAPVIALLKGLTDPLVGLSMGQTAENLAYRFNITREQMDEFAVRSHLRLKHAIDKGWMDEEVMTLYDGKGKFYQQDDGLRPDSSVNKLATLKPFFDKRFGMVTAGNSSQVTDGAAFVVLASEDAVKKHQLPVLGRIIDCEWAGVDPAQMGLGPAHAIAPLLQRNQLSLDNIDCIEINEAFAAQVIACQQALASDDYCQQHFGTEKAIGKIDDERLNVDGGAVAVGHPVGASGARVLLHTLNVLRRQQAKYGIASLCIGGGQGGAMLVEQVAEVN